MAALPEVLGASGLAQVLGITPRWVQKLTQQGVLTRDGRGQYPLAENVQAWAHWRVESELAKVAQPDSPSFRKDEVRTRLLDLQLAREERQLVDIDEAEEVLDRVVGFIITELDGLPKRCSRDLATQSQIEAETRALRTRVADKCEKASRELGKAG